MESSTVWWLCEMCCTWIYMQAYMWTYTRGLCANCTDCSLTVYTCELAAIKINLSQLSLPCLFWDQFNLKWRFSAATFCFCYYGH